jgi:hypothetical protein
MLERFPSSSVRRALNAEAWRVLIAGGVPELLARSPDPFPWIHALVVDESHLYWIATSSPLANGEPGALYRVSKCPGGTIATVARDVLETPLDYAGSPLTQSGEYLYWSYDRFLVRASK